MNSVRFFTVVAAVIMFSLIPSVQVNAGSISSDRAEISESHNKMKWRIADSTEGRRRMASHKERYDAMSQINLDVLMGKTSATADEYLLYCTEQVRDFTDEQKSALNSTLEEIQADFDEIGFNFPLDEEIVFIKTTMNEQREAVAYTTYTEIYLDEHFVNWYKANNAEFKAFYKETLVHEIFHVLSRNCEEFRVAMYSVIGFEIGEDVFIPDNIKERIFSNPDVERFDYYADFEYKGEQRKGIVISLWSKDILTNDPLSASVIETYILFVDTPDTLIPISEVNFFDVVGKNTDYIIAPEEILADNFKYAVCYGMDREYSDPEIVCTMLDLIKSENLR